ncbi:MAG: site-2 protease family protein, partial [Deltaproteobacteria bacterium]|nr:site-2 protease family protein [Deltaproteobacteria bacterium]
DLSLDLAPLLGPHAKRYTSPDSALAECRCLVRLALIEARNSRLKSALEIAERGAQLLKSSTVDAPSMHGSFESVTAFALARAEDFNAGEEHYRKALSFFEQSYGTGSDIVSDVRRSCAVMRCSLSPTDPDVLDELQRLADTLLLDVTPLSFHDVELANELLVMLGRSHSDLSLDIFRQLEAAEKRIGNENPEAIAAIRTAMASYHQHFSDLEVWLRCAREAVAVPGRYQFNAGVIAIFAIGKLAETENERAAVISPPIIDLMLSIGNYWIDLPRQALYCVEITLDQGNAHYASARLEKVHSYIEHFAEGLKLPRVQRAIAAAMTLRVSGSNFECAKQLIEILIDLQRSDRDSKERRVELEQLCEHLATKAIWQLRGHSDEEFAELRRLASNLPTRSVILVLDHVQSTRLATDAELTAEFARSADELKRAESDALGVHGETAIHFAKIAMALEKFEDAERALVGFVRRADKNESVKNIRSEAVFTLTQIMLAERRFEDARDIASESGGEAADPLSEFIEFAEKMQKTSPAGARSQIVPDLNRLRAAAREGFIPQGRWRRWKTKFARTKVGKRLLSTQGLFVLTAVLFLLSFGLNRWQQALIFFAVVLLHELGHVAAMRYYGCKNTSILFVPFLGALARGLPSRPLTPVESFVVAAAGPFPGIALGLLLDWGLPTQFRTATVTNTAYLLLALNWFNLIPISPLDGSTMLRQVGVAKRPLVSLTLLGMSVAAFIYLALDIPFFWVIVLVLIAQFAAEARLVAAKRLALKKFRRDDLWRDDDPPFADVMEFLTENVPLAGVTTVRQQHIAQYLIEMRKSVGLRWRTQIAMCVVLVIGLLVPLASIVIRPLLTTSATRSFIDAYGAGQLGEMEAAHREIASGGVDTFSSCIAAGLIAIDRNSLADLERAALCAKRAAENSDDDDPATLSLTAINLQIAIAEATGNLDEQIALEEKRRELDGDE